MAIIINGSEIAPAFVDLIPQPSNATPPSETNGGNPGTNSAKFSMEGHQHPRLTSSTMAVLDANGEATVVFTRPFNNMPCIVPCEVNSTGNQPLVLVGKNFIQDGAGKYTGVVIKGYRSQALPNQQQINLTSLLTSLINGVNAIASSLTGYNIFGGTPAGAQVSVVAIARSDV